MMMIVVYIQGSDSRLFMKLSVVSAILRKNLICIAFPVFTTWAIYADWSRTRRYKAEKERRLTERLAQ